MSNLPSTSIPPSRFNDFLFALICDEVSGTPLSVLSALARQNVDPWEEAHRLAVMPKAVALKAFTSALNQIPNKSWTISEAEAVAARLVILLPPESGQPQLSTPTLKFGVQQVAHWWMWVGFAIAMSLSSAHHQTATTQDAGVSSPPSALSANANSGSKGINSP